MTSYSIVCARCGKQTLQGTHAPTAPAERSWAARTMRIACRARGCRFEYTQSDEPLPMLDQIRLGLVDDQQAAGILRKPNV